MRKKCLAIFIAVCMLLCACGSSDGGVIVYEITSGAQTLDPQFATGETERMIIANVMEGLFRISQAGTPELCIAREYTVSEDRKTYTFTLRDDAKWSNGEAVTAHDFAFALRRMFHTAAPSPFAEELAIIKNARQVLDGTRDIGALGVQAQSDTVLQIELERADETLLSLLGKSYSMPCNQAFFEGTYARYGQEIKQMLFNGPYVVRAWNNESKITLRRNENYVSDTPAQALGVDLMIQPDGQSAERFLAGETDASRIDYPFLAEVIESGGSGVAFEDTVWVLVFNQNDPVFGDARVRTALAMAVDRSLFADVMPDNLRTAQTLLPPVVPDQGQVVPLAADLQSAKTALNTALADHGMTRLSVPEILICDSDDHARLAGQIQKNWQQLSVQSGLRRLPEEELLAQVQAGNFRAAIVPMTAAYASPEAMLTQFVSDHPQNAPRYRSGYYDSLLSVADSPDNDFRKRGYTRAHQVLLDEGVVIPLYYEVSCYAMAKGVRGIEFSPFLSDVYFKYASKE